MWSLQLTVLAVEIAVVVAVDAVVVVKVVVVGAAVLVGLCWLWCSLLSCCQ